MAIVAVNLDRRIADAHPSNGVVRLDASLDEFGPALLPKAASARDSAPVAVTRTVRKRPAKHRLRNCRRCRTRSNSALIGASTCLLFARRRRRAGLRRRQAWSKRFVRQARERLDIMRLHPEHAELRPLGDRRVQRCGEGEAEHVAGLRGVDDAVVPQPRGRVPGIALRFVIVADRLLECSRPAPASICRRRGGRWRARSPPARRPSR